MWPVCMSVSCARVVGPGPARQQDSQWGEVLHTGPEWPPAALQSQEGRCQVCRQEPPCWQGEGEQWSGRSQPASRLLHRASQVSTELRQVCSELELPSQLLLLTLVAALT